MKKLVLAALVAVLFASCEKKEAQDKSDQGVAIEDASRRELEEAVANRDSLLMLVNQISDGMEQIKRLENILSVPTREMPSERDRILADIAAIQASIEQRRQQLQALEARLRQSSLANTELKRTIDNLRAQIDSQTAEISSLRAMLTDANNQISRLEDEVGALNTTVDTISAQRNEALARNDRLTDQLNTCYYVAASSKELKEHDILHSGFLRKTRILEGEFDMDFFTKADKSTLRRLPLYSKKAKVLTNQPASSYEIVDENGQKVLRILDPAAFWSLSNFLVIQID